MPKARTWVEYKIQCEAVAKEGITILGFIEPWCGAETKLICNCAKHGAWDTTKIANFKRGGGCPICHKLKNCKNNKFPDSYHIEGFMNSGKFKIGTEFYRKQGSKIIWYYICPDCSNDEYVKNGLCSGLFYGNISNFKGGSLSCRCSKTFKWTREQREYQILQRIQREDLKYEFLNWDDGYKKFNSKFTYTCKEHGKQSVALNSFLIDVTNCAACKGHNQKFAYINQVYDANVNPVALKFGITCNVQDRLFEQNRRNLFQMVTLTVYKFKSIFNTKGAEAFCREHLERSDITKRELKDGYTETTGIINYDKIIEIYERFGGIRIEDDE